MGGLSATNCCMRIEKLESKGVIGCGAAPALRLFALSRPHRKRVDLQPRRASARRDLSRHSVACHLVQPQATALRRSSHTTPC